MRKKMLAAVVSMSLIALPLSGCGNKAPEEKVEIEAVRVAVAAAKKGDIANVVKATGSLKAQKEVGVVAKTGGKVSQVRVKVGDKVKAGDVLIQLDTSDLVAQIKAAEAGIALSQAGQKQAAIQYKDAKDNLARMELLFKEGAISQLQLDGAKMQFDLASANYNPEGGTSMTQAQINQAKAQLETLKVSLSNLTITAPISGVISAKAVEPGEMASPGAPLLTIVNDDQMLVEATVPEGEVNLVAPGTEVEVIVKSAKAEPYKGKVTTVSPNMDQRTRAYNIEISLLEKDDKLKGGMMAEAILVADIEKGLLTIPKVAIVDRGNEKFVYVIKENKAEKRIIEIGRGDKDKVEVTNGLTEGEQVVTAGQQLIADESPVKVQGGE